MSKTRFCYTNGIRFSLNSEFSTQIDKTNVSFTSPLTIWHLIAINPNSIYISVYLLSGHP